MPALLTVEEYRDRVMALAPTPTLVRLPLAEALGLVLAEDVHSLVNVPGFANSAMDGYAVRFEDVQAAVPGRPVTLAVTADIPAGAWPTSRLEPGQAARIMTGAPVPAGADTVVPVEDTAPVSGALDHVMVRRAPTALGRHVRLAGEDIMAGSVVLAKGMTLGPAQLAAAAAAGHGHLTVYRAPRLAVVVTGNELAQPGVRLNPGQIYDSNTIMLQAALQQAGATVAGTWHVPDRLEDLAAALDQAPAVADGIVLAGGVSVGDYDVVRQTLRRAGGATFQVKVKPGKPQGLGLWRGTCPMIALPGNPVSAYLSFTLYMEPFLAAAAGRTPSSATHHGVTEVGWDSPPSKRQYVPVTVSPAAQGEDNLIRPVGQGGLGSHLAITLAKATAWAVVPETTVQVEPGDQLDLIPLRRG